jgi:hypothetical protein
MQMGIRAGLLLLFFCLSISCGKSEGNNPDDPNNPKVEGGSTLEVWTQSTRTKVQLTTVPTLETSVEIEGPTSSYQAYQIIVSASGPGGLRGVRAEAGDLVSDAGDEIQASNLTLFRQWFIDFTGVDAVGGSEPVPEHSASFDALVPDPLIPLDNPIDGEPLGAPFDVAENGNQPLWLDVYIPPGTPPGTYTGEVTIEDADNQSAEVPITLEVWDLNLPDMTAVTTWFIFRIDTLVEYHSGTEACYPSGCWLDWTERPRTIVKRYEELAHQHRIDTGPQFVHEPSNGCEVPTDFAEFDADMAPYMDGSYFVDGVPITRLPVGFTPGTMEWGLGAGCSEAEYSALAAAWAAHLKEKAWFDRSYIYALDEPPESAYPDIALHSSWLQAGDPGWKERIILTTTPKFEYADLLNPAVGIYDINPPYFSFTEDPNTVDSHVDAYGRFSVDELFQQGIRIWFYESCSVTPPSPTFGTNTLDGAEPQMLMWGSWFERATGFLFWAVNAWDLDDPWGTNHEAYSKTGDGVLLYPGHHDGQNAPHGSPEAVAYDGPIPSYRLKMIRAGLQDWALFSLADSLGLGDSAREEVSRVYGQFHGCDWSGCAPPISGFYWNTDVSLMNEIRKNIAQAIMAEMKK